MRNRWFHKPLFHQAGFQFVDVVETLPDGRLMVNYEKFHHIIKEEK